MGEGGRRLRGLAAGFGETVDDFVAAWRGQAALLADAPERAIADQQFLATVRNMPANLVATGVGVVLFILALWSAAPLLYVLLWGGWAMSSVVSGVVSTRQFLRSPPAGEALREWELGFRRGLVLVSVMWGSLTFIPVPAQVTPYVAMGLLLVIAGSVGLCANYRPGVSLISVPCALMASAALMRTGQWLGVASGIGFLVAVAEMVRVARAHNTAITRAMQVAEERKALFEELNLRRREAEGASVAKTFLLASVSHDLRQPMHSMALLVAAARQRGRADTSTVEQIGASVGSMEDLLGALLEVSQLDAGTVALQQREFAMGDVLERVRLQFAPQACAKGLRLHVTRSAARVRSDVFHIERVLSNLVANAIRYTHSGGVTVRCRARAGTLWIQVWDSGVGIAREHLGKVFEEFFQVSRTARSGKQGLGLGLSIVQRTVQRLNHALRVRSRPGRGSLFEVGVPLAPAHAPQTMDQ